MQPQAVKNICVNTYTPPFVATMLLTMVKKMKLKVAVN